MRQSRGQHARNWLVYLRLIGSPCVSTSHVEREMLQPPKPSDGRQACSHASSRRAAGEASAETASSHERRMRASAQARPALETTGSVTCAAYPAMGAAL